MAMRVAGILVVAVAFTPCAALGDIKRHASIPEAVQGTWAVGAGGCEPDDKSLIVLTAKTYASGDAKCTVDWVSETAGSRGPIYSARLRCGNPPAQKASNLIIRPDGADQISAGADFSHLAAYQRCAAKQ
jgi:hypothetical protein